MLVYWLTAPHVCVDSLWFRASEPARYWGEWYVDLLLLPETVLTKICIVSSASELDELMLEMLEVRRMVAIIVRCARAA